jgi:hypothetical protein
MAQEPDWISRKRVFPRAFSVFYLYIFGTVNDLFWALPDPTNAQGVAYGALCGSAAAWFKFYVESGNSTDITDKS